MLQFDWPWHLSAGSEGCGVEYAWGGGSRVKDQLEGREESFQTYNPEWPPILILRAEEGRQSNFDLSL